jgi:uncharacterized membrane protein YdbT with pleckstrin-like domain
VLPDIEMAQRNSIRASDADREQIAERLRHAAAEGRLLAEELEQRLGAAFKARTYGELDAVVADLPGRRTGSGSSRSMIPFARPAMALAILVAAVVVILAAVVVIAGVLAVWAVSVLVAWWVFGGRHYHCRRSVRRGHRWQVRGVGGRAQPRAWL